VINTDCRCPGCGECDASVNARAGRRPVVRPVEAIPEPHWKVGDGMHDGYDSFIIGTIAVVDIGNGNFEIRYYDQQGVCRGDQKVKV
jgi:hypothetical protein